MQKFYKLYRSLTARVLLIVVVSQLLILSFGGLLYVNNLTEAIDEKIEGRLNSIGVLLQESQLKYTALSERTVLTELVGDQLLDGMVVGVNGTIYHALDKSFLGKTASAVQGLQLNWFNPTNIEQQIIRQNENGTITIASITPIFTLSSTRPFLFGYIKIDATKFQQEKQQIIWQIISSIAAVIFTTSLLVFFFLRGFIFNRIYNVVAFIKSVSEGNLNKKLNAPKNDELGVLERGLNNMVSELETRRQRSIKAEMLLREANENLENRVEERTKALQNAANEVRSEAENHKKTSEALKQKSAYMYLLQRIIVSVNEVRSVDEAWRVGLATVQKHFAWPVGMVYVMDEQRKDILTYESEVCITQTKELKKLSDLSKHFSYNLGEGLVGSVLRSGRPQLLKIEAGATRGQPRLDVALSAGLNWSFAIPVLVGRDVVAVMEFFAQSEIVPHSELFEIARDVGIQLGRAVERRQAEDSIKQAKQISDEANRAKTEFLTKLGHELRIPINAIVGFTQLMQVQAEKSTQEQRYDQLKTISKAGLHLAYLVDQMTDLARIEAGGLTIQPQTINVVDSIDIALEKVMPLMHSKDIHLELDMAIDQLQKLSIDQDVFVQIIQNILLNAIHYAGVSRIILVQSRYSTQHDFVEVAIADQGQPLTKEEQQIIFKPLYRIKRHRKNVDGLGIGLTLSKELTNTMGGDLIVLSGKDALQVGTIKGNTFIVRLPISEHKQKAS